MVSQKQLPHYDMQTQGGSDNTAAISSDMFSNNIQTGTEKRTPTRKRTTTITANSNVNQANNQAYYET